ncbi:YgfZ/GcvT domain-containing protein [Hyphococcus luteus]|nr:folate-binding protein YgfZ [Marinicaulis flavus]
MSQTERLSDRAVIRLEGEDRLSFLQGVVTQDLDRLKEAPAIFAALLTPQGKILFDFFIVKADGALYLDCNAEAAPALLKRLSLYKLRAKVALEIDESLHVVASESELNEGFAFADPRLAALGWRALVENGDDAEDGDYDRRRIAHGVPEFGKDFASDEMFLLDVNYDALAGVSYKKGCFIGQEVSSRMKRKGDPRRRTAIATFEGPAPEKGAAITAGGSTLGEIMSGTGTGALAMIRLDRWEKAETEETPVECGGAALLLQIPAYLEQG